MRLFAFAVGLLGCAPTPAPSAAPPAPMPPPAPVVTRCPPPGTWTLTAKAACATGPERHVLAIHVGAPEPRDPSPMFDVLAPIVASGRTTTGFGPDRLVRISDARATAVGCEMQLHMEYVGPHSAIEYKAKVLLVSGHLSGAGTYEFLVEDCKFEDPNKCRCASAMNLEGDVR